MRASRITRAWTIVTAGAVAAAGCFSERAAGPAAADVSAVPCAVADVAALQGAGKALVFVKDFAFHPDTVRVRPGTTVVWLNCDAHADPHTTTSDAGLWASDFLPVGRTFSRHFDQAGQFGYHCTPHPFMKGTIVVDAAAPDVVALAGQ